MEDADVQGIHKRMDKLSEQIDGMQKTLEKIAVQDEQIKQLQSESMSQREKLDAQRERIDKLTGSDGPIYEMKQFQASCPRRHIWAMWIIVVPMGLALLKFVYGA